VYSINTLLVFIVVYVFCSGITGGLSVPFGTFVPNLFAGAALGRAMGVFVDVKMGYPNVSSPGTYALLGAGAMLGGYTRMTMTVVVMMAEASGDASIVIPMMLAVSIARYTASMVCECYDEKMMELRNIPFLHDECQSMRKGDNSSDIMIQFDCLKVKEPQHKLQRSIKRANAYPCAAFPVVDDDGKLIGLVNANILDKVLSNVNDVRARRSIADKADDTEGGVEMKSMDKEKDVTFDDVVGGGTKRRKSVFRDELLCNVHIEQFMDPAPYSVLENFPLSRLFPLFRKLRVEHVVVINKTGHPVGVVPKTALIEVDGGHVNTTHNLALKKVDIKGIVSDIADDEDDKNMNENTRRLRKGTTAGYEKGELFEDAAKAEVRINRLFKWAGFGNDDFVSRSSGFGDGLSIGERQSDVRDRQSSLEVNVRDQNGLARPVELFIQDGSHVL
jgi:hypothetical protein